MVSLLTTSDLRGMLHLTFQSSLRSLHTQKLPRHLSKPAAAFGENRRMSSALVPVCESIHELTTDTSFTIHPF